VLDKLASENHIRYFKWTRNRIFRNRDGRKLRRRTRESCGWSTSAICMKSSTACARASAARNRIVLGRRRVAIDLGILERVEEVWTSDKTPKPSTACYPGGDFRRPTLRNHVGVDPPTFQTHERPVDAAGVRFW